jgi:hypothetical protein
MTPEDFLGADRASLFGLDPNTVPQQSIGIGDGNPQPFQWYMPVAYSVQVFSTAGAEIIIDGPITSLQFSGTPGTTLTRNPVIADGHDGQRVVFVHAGNTFDITNDTTNTTSNLRLPTTTVSIPAVCIFELVFSSAMGGWTMLQAPVVIV